MMKRLIILIAIVSMSIIVFSQNDIQSWQARVNQVITKSVEKLSQDDISFLKSVINMNSERFGSDFQRVVDDKKSDAKNVLIKYEAWLSEKTRKEELDAELGTEKIKTAAQQEVILAQGDTILEQKQIIDKLNDELARLKSEMRKLNRTNDKLKDENSNLEQIMVDNQKIVERMRVMLSGNSQLKANAPSDLKAELEGAECEIAEVMKQNYILTIEKLKKDKEYLERIQKEYEETKVYPEDFNSYITTGEALATRFSGSTIPCVNQKATDILASIDELKMMIEKKDGGFFASIGRFLIDNLLLTGLILLVLIGAILFFVLRKK